MADATIQKLDNLEGDERPANIDTDGGMAEDLTLPPKRYEKLEVNGKSYDLRKANEAEEAEDATRDYRQSLREDKLDDYEEKGTEYGQGGRSRLLYDEVRAKLAADYHEGKHTLTWEQQHEQARRIVGIRAAQWRASK